MKTILTLIIIFHLNTILGQTITLKGKITDAGSSKPVSLAAIKAGNNAFAISDYKGRFTLYLLPGDIDLVISRIGYKTIKKHVLVKKGYNLTLKIELQKKSFMLNEVTVIGNMTTRKMIQKVRTELKNTLQVGLYTSKGFERTVHLKNGNYVFFAEAITDNINGGYAPVGHAYPFTRAIEYRIGDIDYSLHTMLDQYVFPINVKYSLYCYDHILIPILLEEVFDFSCTDTIISQQNMMAVIMYKFNPDKYKKFKGEITKSKYNFMAERYQYGKIIINIDDYSVCEIVNKKDDNTISKASFTKAFGRNFLSMRELLSTYIEPSINNNDSDILVKSTIIRFKDFDTTRLTDKIISQRFNCKVKIDNRFKTQQLWFTAKTVTDKDKISMYKPSFWQDMPVPSNWEKICNDMQEKYGMPIYDQFKQNSEYLYSESEYLKTIKHIPDKRMRKKYMKHFNEMKKYNLFKQ